jgi:hypothetical protein
MMGYDAFLFTISFPLSTIRKLLASVLKDIECRTIDKF